MRKSSGKTSTAASASKAAGSSFLTPLLWILCLVFVGTSGMLGYVLGKNASQGTGELIDTIVLSPGDEGQSAARRHFLSGKLLYADGAPCGSAVIQIKESGRTDKTDAQGKFYFSEITSGKHTLEVSDNQGELLAAAPFTVDFSGNGPSADVTGSPMVFQLPEDARMLEMTLTVEEDKSLTVKAGEAYFVTGDGSVADFSGSMVSVGQETYAVLPGGGVISPGGYVLLPSRETVFTPGGMEAGASDSTDGIQRNPDGSVQTPDGVVIAPDSTVTSPGGDTLSPSNKVVIIKKKDAEELEQLPEPYEPKAPGNAARPEESTGEPAGDENKNSPENSSPSSAAESSVIPPENAPPQATPEPTPEEGGLAVSDQTGLIWQQRSMVDLFKNRTSGEELGEENGMPVIAPGSSGFYEFQLENKEEFEIDYCMAIEERSFHIPVRYSIVDQSNQRTYLYGSKWNQESGLSTPVIRIPANSCQRYKLVWEWQYEDEEVREEDDVYDMAAATREDRVYIISVSIGAEQVIPPVEDPAGDGTRYPGKR